MRDLSILIPARNEEFLKNTIEDILKNIEADTEVIVALDGQWARSPIEQHDRVNLIYVKPAIGQRAAQNLACRLSRAKYVMKLDAHCSFDKGFDRKMLEAFSKVEDNVVILPVMRNLWAYDWKCYKCGKRIYQDKKPKCPVCGHKMKKKMLWIGKERPQSDSYCFNAIPTFAYFGEYRKRPEYKKDKEKRGLTETMSIQGSCFMCLRQLYWDWNLCDEALGSWGHQGIEVACKIWLKGGRALVNHETWYAHMFRTKSGTFGFPWPASGRDQRKVKNKVWKQIIKGLPAQKHPVSWLVEKFWPVKGWTDKDLKELKTNEAKLDSKHTPAKPVRKKSSLFSSGVIFSSQPTNANDQNKNNLTPDQWTKDIRSPIEAFLLSDSDQVKAGGAAISIIVPSRGRPDELLTSLNSLGLAKNGLEALVWLDNDDPKLAKYQELFGSNPNVKLFIKKRVGYKNFHVMVNFLASQASFDWLFLWNDDAVMVNPDWFKIFKDFVKQFEPANQPVVINIWGQGKTTKNLFPIVSQSYFDVLGHFSLSLACDFWAQLVSLKANIVYDLKGIKPKHLRGTEIRDQTLKEVRKAWEDSNGQWDPRRNGSLKSLLKQDIKKIIQYKKMTIGFIGLGKLGLPIAETIAKKGFKVIGYDIKPVKTSLALASSIKEVVQKSDLVFCAVQTPHKALYEGNKLLPKTRADFDYSYLLRAIKDAAAANKKTNLVVISTCLPGTFERKIKPLLTEKINYLYNPFFTSMGSAPADFLNPEFVLIGGDRPAILKDFYLKIFGEDKTFITDITTAEGIKVFYNTFVTTKTVLANIYGEYAHKTGMNVDHIYQALTKATERLISPEYLKSGMGDGGSCHPRDNIALSYLAKKIKMSFNFFDCLMMAREKHTKWLAKLFSQEMKSSGLPGIILGKSFKPKVDLQAGSAAILLANILKRRKVKFQHYEFDYPKKLPKAVYFIATKHKEYQNIFFPKASIIIDPFRYIPEQKRVKIIAIGKP